VTSIRTTHGVGNRLADADTAELGDPVIERLQVLDVERGQHVDAGFQDVLDVLVALGVLEARGIGVGQLVDQAQLGVAVQDRRQVHLLQFGAAVVDAAPRDHRQPLGQGGRLGPAVRLEQADDDVASILPLDVSLLEHPVRLPDAGSHPQVHLQPPPARLDRAGASRRRERLVHAPRRLCTSRSMSLIPMNGTTTPPSP
jgi:hypothetical protein